jgi:cysteine synthase A
MEKLKENIETLIGNTPLVTLKKASVETGAKILAKLEKNNPGGSIKDRVAKAIIEDAEKNGRLQAGGTVIEATSGNTGIGLALVCKARGYKAIIVMPDSMSIERQKLILEYVGEVVLTEGKKGMQGAVEKAEELLKSKPNAIIADQFNNPVCASVHYRTTGAEIYRQTEGNVDVFVACVGTGGTLSGVGKYLKEKNPAVKVVAVEPASSPLLSGGKAGAHAIQGIGANFIPSILDRDVYDEVVTVTDEEAFESTRTLFKEERLFVGISSGAAVAAAKKIASRAENRGKTIVTVLPDDGDRYLSTAIFE